MTRNNFSSVLYPILLIGLVTSLVSCQRDKTAFFYNQKVFDQFKGKLELEEKLKTQAATDKKLLDSLHVLIEQGRKDLTPVYDEAAQKAGAAQQDLNSRYTADVWRYINEGVADFGKEKGYDYIFGASGNGSLMYADTTHDVTADVVSFLNARYSK